MKMIDYTRILFPYDGSKLSLAALPHLITLANAFDAEIIALRVIESVPLVMATIEPSPLILYGEQAVSLSQDIVADERHKAQHSLAKLEANLNDLGFSKITTIIEEGTPSPSIINCAQKNNCDLIVMSTHGRSRLGRTLLGSVADEVVHKANCPVLLIRPNH